MSSLQRLLARIVFPVLPESDAIYRLCRQYVDRYNGENNDDIATNGELRFMRQVLPRCTTVLDVGANVGDWAALALQINPRLGVHCFEPSRSTYEALVARAFPPNVVCNDFGLGAAKEERALHVFEDRLGMNSLYRRRGLEAGWGLAPQERTEMIRLDTLDGYCRDRGIPHVDFVKVDVEGHELEVFRGATQMFSQGRINIMQFEYGGCNIDARVLLRDLYDFFRAFDYFFWKIYPDSLRRVERYDQRLENFQYQNWIVARTDWTRGHHDLFV